VPSLPIFDAFDAELLAEEADMVIDPGLFWLGIALVLVTLGLTVYVFRHRLFERGLKKGVAANPREVRRENPPDGR
jgi:hypothetical protein